MLLALQECSLLGGSQKAQVLGRRSSNMALAQDLWRAETCVLKRGYPISQLPGGAFVHSPHVATGVNVPSAVQL